MFNELNEFETKDITVYDYLHARDLMVKERQAVWERYVRGNFENDSLGELIETYDFVSDTLTCLAIELDKKNKGMT